MCSSDLDGTERPIKRTRNRSDNPKASKVRVRSNADLAAGIAVDDLILMGVTDMVDEFSQMFVLQSHDTDLFFYFFTTLSDDAISSVLTSLRI